MIDTVIFDLDGTLFDTIDDIGDANNRMLKIHGFPQHQVSDYVGWIGNGAKKLVYESLPEEARIDDTFVNACLDEYNLIYSENLWNKSKIYDGMAEVLDYLSQEGIKIAINTNKPQPHTDMIVSKWFSKWDFKLVIGQSGIFPKKPDPAGAEHILSSINGRAENTVFIGDSMVDMNTAKNGKMIPLGVSWGYDLSANEQNNQDFSLVNNPISIIEFIKGLNTQ